MVSSIKKVAVIGSGPMGSGIAAQVTNAGIPVVLLDLDKKIADEAILKMKSAHPSDLFNNGFMSQDNHKLITTGSTNKNLDLIKDCDIIIEATSENLKIKHDVLDKIYKVAKPEAIITSNTSTLNVSQLTQNAPADRQSRFLNTHFFNPVRFMNLVEIISGQNTKPEVTDEVKQFCDEVLGKNVVLSNDQPGFITTRLGSYFLNKAISETIKSDVNIEDADLVFGQMMGFPKAGVFGLVDLVGVDIFSHVSNSLKNHLSTDDPFQHTLNNQNTIDYLLNNNALGRKSGNGGFYRVNKLKDGSKVKEVLDLNSKGYRPISAVHSVSFAPSKREFFDSDGKLNSLAWDVMRDTLTYAMSFLPDVTENISDIDLAMREGYNWEKGPFEILDELGHEFLKNKFEQQHIKIPEVLKLADGKPFYRVHEGKKQSLRFDFQSQQASYVDIKKPEGILDLNDIKIASKPLMSNPSASLWDIGDGIACFEFHSKMNTVDANTLLLLNRTIDYIENKKNGFKGLVIYNDGQNFSRGANIDFATVGFQLAQNTTIQSLGLSSLFNKLSSKITEKLLYQGQSTYKALHDSSFPVVGATHNQALGGAFELLLNCNSVQAYAESQLGLPEMGLGLLPAWLGCTRYLERTIDQNKGSSSPDVVKTFNTFLLAHKNISLSAQDSRKNLWLRDGDGITMNRSRLLADAKNKAIHLSANFQPKINNSIKLPGKNGKTSIYNDLQALVKKQKLSNYDVLVSKKVADILTGNSDQERDVSTNEIAYLERCNVHSLLLNKKTHERIQYTLKTGRPLKDNDVATLSTLKDIFWEAESECTLPFKSINSKPLTGRDRLELQVMASATNLYSMFKKRF